MGLREEKREVEREREKCTMQVSGELHEDAVFDVLGAA